MNIREDVIYARQSVDRKDSISIESQIDFCKYELKGGSCRVFKDKGYSGKNTDRPEFQKLLGEIRKGKVRRVVVYKLDRIDVSLEYNKAVAVALSKIQNEEIDLVILQSRSPTCGVNQIYDGSFTGKLVSGMGLFAKALKQKGYHVIDVEEI